MKVLTKKEFCDIINDLYEYEIFLTQLNGALRYKTHDNNISNIGLEETVVKTLEIIFDDKITGWISYWIWELNFGKRYTEGDVTEKDEIVIPLKTAEELYDFLIKNMEKNNNV